MLARSSYTYRKHSMEWALGLQDAAPVTAPRLEDRIRTLCVDVIAAEDDHLEPSLSELKAALHQHTERLRKVAAARLASIVKPAP